MGGATGKTEGCGYPKCRAVASLHIMNKVSAYFMLHGLRRTLVYRCTSLIRCWPSCKRWRSNPSGKCSQERLARGTVASTMRRAAHPSGSARCGAGAGCSAMKYQSLLTLGCTLQDGSMGRLMTAAVLIFTPIIVGAIMKVARWGGGDAGV